MISAQRRTSAPKKELPPLQNGDHLDQKTFHERYEAMPGVRAQLIGGIVFMSSPMKPKHGRFGVHLSAWLGAYEDGTPGTEALAGTTSILGPESEPEPDGCLRILPSHGGKTWENENGYLTGSPEWVGEISDSTESIDLHSKKLDYEQGGVQEYMVAAIRTRQICWFTCRRGKFRNLGADSDGIFRSRVFPGLWLDGAAFLDGNRKRVLAVLRQGMASPEHAAFVAKLARKKR